MRLDFLIVIIVTCSKNIEELNLSEINPGEWVGIVKLHLPQVMTITKGRYKPATYEKPA